MTIKSKRKKHPMQVNWYEDARSYGHIQSKPQMNYDLTEGIRVSNTKEMST